MTCRAINQGGRVAGAFYTAAIEVEVEPAVETGNWRHFKKPVLLHVSDSGR
jgi:hypothetical protein